MTQTEKIPRIRIEKRKLTASGNSVVLTVPKEWLEEKGLKSGQEVLMIMNGDLVFKVANHENITKIRNQLLHNTSDDHAGLSATSFTEGGSATAKSSEV